MTSSLQKKLLQKMNLMGYHRIHLLILTRRLLDEINELFEQLEKHVGKPHCISELLASSMSNNISSLVFGKRLKYNDPDRLMMTRILKETSVAGQSAMWQMFFPTLKKIFETLGIGDVHKIRRIQKELKDYVKKAIDEHAATLDPNNIRDYIDAYLLEIEKKKNNPSFCKSVLEDLVLLLFGAGSETVRMGVEWLVLTAAQHPEGQRRIQHEIDDAIGRNQITTWMDRKSMPYTEAFIMELMRWKTIIPIAAFRYAIAGGNVGGHYIPKHTMIMSNFWGIHHNPTYWGVDAEEFIPERFLSDDGQEVKKWEHYLPFSIGKRACLGEPLAKIEIFLYFVSILQRFDISVPDGKILDFDGEFGLLPKPQELIFSKRK